MGRYTLHKAISISNISQYLNLGWEQVDALDDTHVSVRKIIYRNNQEIDDNYICQFRQPHLMQRGKIRRPLGQFTDATIARAVQMDYMGAAEFEYGALPKSLCRVEAQWPLYKAYVFDEIVAYKDDKPYPMYVYANFEDDQRERYSKFLDDIIHCKCYKNMKEVSYLESNTPTLTIPANCDFWWDIKNDVFLSFDKQFMSRIDHHLRNSFQETAKGD